MKLLLHVSREQFALMQRLADETLLDLNEEKWRRGLEAIIGRALEPGEYAVLVDGRS